MKRVGNIVAIIAGVVAILAAIWGVSQWAFQLNGQVAKINEEIAKLKQQDERTQAIIARVLLVSESRPDVRPSGVPIPISVKELAGAWDLKFRSTGALGRVVISALGDNGAEFFGELSQGDKLPPLKVEGHGTLNGKMARINFLTKSDRGETWHGHGKFSIDSRNVIRGWYVDMNGKIDIIDLRRAP